MLLVLDLRRAVKVFKNGWFVISSPFRIISRVSSQYLFEKLTDHDDFVVNALVDMIVLLSDAQTIVDVLKDALHPFHPTKVNHHDLIANYLSLRFPNLSLSTLKGLEVKEGGKKKGKQGGGSGRASDGDFILVEDKKKKRKEMKETREAKGAHVGVNGRPVVGAVLK